MDIKLPNSAKNLHTLDNFWRVISYNYITYNRLFERNKTELVEVHQQILKGDKNGHLLMLTTSPIKRLKYKNNSCFREGER